MSIKMKKQLVIICLLAMGCVGIVSAQKGGAPNREKIEAMKVGFITQKLDLTSEEAQKFWPVYNRFAEEMEKSRKDFRGKMMEEVKDVDLMTDAEANKALNDMIAYKTSEVELFKKYNQEFKKVLPTKKVVKLYLAEQEFKRELLRKLKSQK
jgi:Skp family chaperone for outer membrane proteins